MASYQRSHRQMNSGRTYKKLTRLRGRKVKQLLQSANPRSHTPCVTPEVISTQSTSTSSTTNSTRALRSLPFSCGGLPNEKGSMHGNMVDYKNQDKQQARCQTKKVYGNRQGNCTTGLPMQRVYKQPRQKVRWRCEHCQTLFTTSHVCRICEHQRCASCVRDP